MFSMVAGLQTGVSRLIARLCLATVAFALAAPAASDAQAVTITVQGNANGTGNCIPFGCPGSFLPFMGFVYQNIPAFTVNVGDTIAFDTNAENEVALTFNIFLGATTTNGGTTIDAGGISQVVANGTPADPNGNAVTGDFELAYTVTSAFTFAGGGLVIALEAVGGTTIDTTNNPNLVNSSATDTSNLFVSRFYGLSQPGAGTDVAAGSGSDAIRIGHFRIIAADPVSEPATLALAGLGLAGLGIAARIRRRR